MAKLLKDLLNEWDNEVREHGIWTSGHSIAALIVANLRAASPSDGGARQPQLDLGLIKARRTSGELHSREDFGGTDPYWNVGPCIDALVAEVERIRAAASDDGACDCGQPRSKSCMDCTVVDYQASNPTCATCCPIQPKPVDDGAARPQPAQEEFCLGCGKATTLRDCGCPAGTGWRSVSSPSVGPLDSLERVKQYKVQLPEPYPQVEVNN